MMKAAEKMVPELRFKGFEGEWKKIYLSEILSFKNGINASKDDYGRGYKFINVLDIIRNDFITHDKIIGEVQVSEEAYKKNIVEFGDILFQRSSETREEVGQANVYLDQEKSATFGGFIIRGKSIAEYVPFFINSLLKTSSARKEIVNKSGGSTRYNVGQETLSQVLIKVPSLPEQQKIADFLSAVDQKIQQLQRKKELLAQYKKGMMQKLFSKEIRFKQEDGSDFPQWEEKSIGKHIDLISGIPIKGEDILDEPPGISILRGINITEGFIRHNREIDKYYNGKSNKIDKYIVKYGDLVLGMDGSKVGKNCALVTKKDAGSILIQRVARIRAKSTISLPYLYQHIFSSRFHSYVDKVNTSSGIPHISLKQINSFEIPLPCIEEQQKIANFLSSLDEKVAQVGQQIEQAQRFKKGLLQKMFV